MGLKSSGVLSHYVSGCFDTLQKLTGTVCTLDSHDLIAALLNQTLPKPPSGGWHATLSQLLFIRSCILGPSQSADVRLIPVFPSEVLETWKSSLVFGGTRVHTSFPPWVPFPHQCAPLTSSAHSTALPKEPKCRGQASVSLTFACVPHQ